MAAVSRADATWEGDLMKGGGSVKPASGAFSALPVSWATRAERPSGKTSPEELIAAGHAPERLDTSAAVTFVPGTGITKIELSVRGRVEGLDSSEFERLAREAKEGCPVSQALKGNVEITLDARMVP